MNNRIKELAEQAHIPFKDENSFDCLVFSKEKFAELIVQDCVNVLQDNGMWNSRVSDVLYEHFGVEW